MGGMAVKLDRLALRAPGGHHEQIDLTIYSRRHSFLRGLHNPGFGSGRRTMGLR